MPILLAEIAFQVQEKAFKSLKAPIQRVGNLNTPIPMSKVLRDITLPIKEKIVAAVSCKKNIGMVVTFRNVDLLSNNLYFSS